MNEGKSNKQTSGGGGGASSTKKPRRRRRSMQKKDVAAAPAPQLEANESEFDHLPEQTVTPTKKIATTASSASKKKVAGGSDAVVEAAASTPTKAASSTAQNQTSEKLSPVSSLLPYVSNISKNETPNKEKVRKYLFQANEQTCRIAADDNKFEVGTVKASREGTSTKKIRILHHQDKNQNKIEELQPGQFARLGGKNKKVADIEIRHDGQWKSLSLVVTDDVPAPIAAELENFDIQQRWDELMKIVGGGVAYRVCRPDETADNDLVPRSALVPTDAKYFSDLNTHVTRGDAKTCFISFTKSAYLAAMFSHWGILRVARVADVAVVAKRTRVWDLSDEKVRLEILPPSRGHQHSSAFAARSQEVIVEGRILKGLVDSVDFCATFERICVSGDDAKLFPKKFAPADVTKIENVSGSTYPLKFSLDGRTFICKRPFRDSKVEFSLSEFFSLAWYRKLGVCVPKAALYVVKHTGDTFTFGSVLILTEFVVGPNGKDRLASERDMMLKSLAKDVAVDILFNNYDVCGDKCTNLVKEKKNTGSDYVRIDLGATNGWTAKGDTQKPPAATLKKFKDVRVEGKDNADSIRQSMCLNATKKEMMKRLGDVKNTLEKEKDSFFKSLEGLKVTEQTLAQPQKRTIDVVEVAHSLFDKLLERLKRPDRLISS